MSPESDHLKVGIIPSLEDYVALFRRVQQSLFAIMLHLDANMDDVLILS